MIALSRRRLVGAAASGALAAGLGLSARPARAVEFTFKYANNLPIAHPVNVRAKEAAERIGQDSSGRIKIRVFPDNQLGSDEEILDRTRAGAVDFFTVSGLNLATFVPVAAINGIGFAFKSYDLVWKTMDGPLGAHVRDAIAKAGLVPMERIWDNGYREITTSSKPINVPDDLRGLKIRVPSSPLWTSMFQAFGANPASVGFGDVYAALQSHAVEGQENPLAIIFLAKLYEVQKYCSLTNHIWDGFWMLANPRSWERLPPELRELVAKAWNDAALAERQDIAKLNDTLRASLAGRGMVFNEPDPGPFHDALRKSGFYAGWKARLGEEAWTLLENGVGPLG